MKISMRGTQWKKGVLADGTAVIFPAAGAPIPLTFWARPAVGDTVTVSYSTDSGENWVVWGPGAVTAYAESVFDSGVTAFKVQRTAGSGTTSTYGGC